LTYNTATGRAVIHELQATVLLSSGTTTGTRTVAAAHRNASVKVSIRVIICLFTLPVLLLCRQLQRFVSTADIYDPITYHANTAKQLA